jgi:hypothetical protein
MPTRSPKPAIRGAAATPEAGPSRCPGRRRGNVATSLMSVTARQEGPLGSITQRDATPHTRGGRALAGGWRRRLCGRGAREVPWQRAGIRALHPVAGAATSAPHARLLRAGPAADGSRSRGRGRLTGSRAPSEKATSRSVIDTHHEGKKGQALRLCCPMSTPLPRSLQARRPRSAATRSELALAGQLESF